MTSNNWGKGHELHLISYYWFLLILSCKNVHCTFETYSSYHVGKRQIYLYTPFSLSTQEIDNVKIVSLYETIHVSYRARFCTYWTHLISLQFTRMFRATLEHSWEYFLFFVAILLLPRKFRLEIGLWCLMLFHFFESLRYW